MGTSASRSGQAAQRGSEWSKAKSQVTSFAKGSGASVGSAVGKFVTAIKTQSTPGGSIAGGGGGGTSHRNSSFSSVISAGQALGSFLSGVGSVGLDETLRKQGLENFVGKHPDQVLSAIADSLCNSNGTLDDTLARSAVIEVLSEIFNDDDDTYADLRDRWNERLNEATLQQLMAVFLSQSIFQRFLSELGDRIETNAISVYEAEKKEREVLDFIKAFVKFDLGEIDLSTFDWNGPEGNALLERNLSAALSLL